MNTFDFTLSNPITYHSGGENKPTTLLTFYAPSSKNRKKVFQLKQGAKRAIKDLMSLFDGENKQSEGNEEPDGSAMLEVLQMSDSISYDDYVELFVDLVTSGVCKVDYSEVFLTARMVEDMTCSDLEKIMGEYLVNFILGSLGD